MNEGPSTTPPYGRLRSGRRAALSRLLAVFNGRPGGSSNRILRLLPLDEPPSAAAGEVTDKRSLNARRVLERRAADVERLYAEPPHPDVIVPSVIVAGGTG